MSIQALNWVLKQDWIENSGAKFVLMILANYADEDGVCYPSQATIARLTALKERAVRNHLAWLTEAGMITRSLRRAPGGFRSTDVYQLNLRPRSKAKGIKELGKNMLDLGPASELPAKSAGSEVDNNTLNRQHLPVVTTGKKRPELPAKNDRNNRQNMPVYTSVRDTKEKHTQDACVRDASLKAAEPDSPADVARFQPRDPPRKFKTASPPAGDVPQAFGPWRDAFEDWWCQMLGIVGLPANVDTANDLAWLFDNGFTLDEIKAFYKWATTDPDEKKWRRGPVKIGTIVKGIADWRKQNREQAAAKPVVRQDFSWCLNGCDPKTGEIWLKNDAGDWVPTECQHRRVEEMEDAA